MVPWSCCLPLPRLFCHRHGWSMVIRQRENPIPWCSAQNCKYTESEHASTAHKSTVTLSVLLNYVFTGICTVVVLLNHDHLHQHRVTWSIAIIDFDIWFKHLKCLACRPPVRILPLPHVRTQIVGARWKPLHFCSSPMFQTFCYWLISRLFLPTSSLNTSGVLVHVAYKIIAKTLADIIENHLPHIIHPSQVAFVQGRHIASNIIIAQEIIHSFNLIS